MTPEDLIDIGVGLAYLVVFISGIRALGNVLDWERETDDRASQLALGVSAVIVVGHALGWW